MRLIALASATALFALTQGALAADMPVKAAPVVAPAPTWTGFYVGYNSGFAKQNMRWDYAVVNTTTYPDSDGQGGIIGGQLGFNWQFGGYVFGVEGMYDWANIKGNRACPGAAFTCKSTADALASVTGRLGAVWGPALIYGKGGWGWISNDHVTFLTATGAVEQRFNNDNRSGWTVGGGVEYRIVNNWTWKAEANFYNFGTKSLVGITPAGAILDTVHIRQNVYTISAGVNYLFGWPRI